MNDHRIPILGIKPRKRDDIGRTVNYSFAMRKHWLNDRETVYHNEKNGATKSCDDARERNDIVAGGQAFDRRFGKTTVTTHKATDVQASV